MSEQVIAENSKEREKLLPVALMAFTGYVVIMTFGYFVGNMIYQIP